MTKQTDYLRYYGLDTMGYEVFLQLYNDPLITITQMAKNLDCSTTLITSRLDQLREMEIIRPTTSKDVPLLGQRLQTDMEAIYNPEPLGLQRVNILISQIKDYQSLELLEKLFEIHPYVHYQVRSYFNGVSLFVQFDMPAGKTPYIDKLMDKLSQKDYFDQYLSIDNGIQIQTKIDFNYWKMSSTNWNIDHSKQGSNEIEYSWQEFLDLDNTEKIKAPVPEFAHRFDQYDMKLLRELTVNGRVSPTNIAEFYDIDRSNISRRLNRLRELVAPKNRMYYNHKIFDLTYQQLLIGHFKPDDQMSKDTLYSFLKQNSIPFSSSAVIDDHKFIWHLNTSPSYAVVFTDFVTRHCRDLQIHQLDISSAKRYYFFNVNYVDKLTWIESQEYIIDQPLQLMDMFKNQTNA